MNVPKRIAVLMGGPGSERDVSLATARGVAKALRSRGVEVFEIDVRDENFELPQNIDLAFLAIHGTFGEDGQLQRILENRGLPYTGDGIKESRTAFDKIESKKKFEAAVVVYFSIVSTTAVAAFLVESLAAFCDIRCSRP